MIKNNKLKIAISSLVTVLPIIAGLIFWDRLPDRMATHWSLNGTPDGFSSKAFVVFGMPLVLLAIFWVGIIVTVLDPKNKNQNSKAFGVVRFIVPVISCVLNGVIYATALGKSLNISMIAFLLVGFIFALIGNYLPKCKQNYTIGIKICWTLQNEENWNATHRLAGRLWFISGVIMMLCAFFTESFIISYIIIGVMLLMVAIPIIYSYIFYKKSL